MARDIVDSDQLHASVPFGFSHVAVSGPGRTVHCAGQVAWTREFALVGAGDLAGQARQCLANLRTALAAAGATPADVVRLRTYLVRHTPEQLQAVCALLTEFYGDAPPAPNTVVGVDRLALPEFLVEIEATAVID